MSPDLGWDVLLDAAAFVSTNPLDLSEYKPDFVAVRVTVGIATKFADVHAFLAFLAVLVDKRAVELEAYLDDRRCEQPLPVGHAYPLFAYPATLGFDIDFFAN